MEIWKKTTVNPNYSVSNLGRVRNDRNNYILKPVYDDRGYCYAGVRQGSRYRFFIHRLVAMAFIPNPENKETVNHINGIHDDNRVENLEWSTQHENNQHKYDVLGFRMSSSGRKSLAEKRKKKIMRIEDGKIYDSITEAAEDIKISVSMISMQLHGNYSRAGGYHYEFIEEAENE